MPVLHWLHEDVLGRASGDHGTPRAGTKGLLAVNPTAPGSILCSASIWWVTRANSGPRFVPCSSFPAAVG